MSTPQPRPGEVLTTETTVKETKPGYLTTEFYLTVATNLAALLAALAGGLPPRYAGYVGAVSTGLYAVARGIAKHG